MKKLTKKLQDEIGNNLQILKDEAKILERLALAKEQIKKRLEEGYTIPGYALENDYGNRKYTKNVDLDTLYSTFKKWIPKKSIYTETKILSPAKLEKYFIDVPEAKDLFNDNFIERPYKGKKLVKV